MQRYQSIVLESRHLNDATSVGPLDSTIVIKDIINVNQSRRKYIKPLCAQISTRIPNIYSYGGFNNTTIKVKRNVADAWTTVNFTPGVYTTVSDLGAALTAALASWYTDASIPAIRLDANTVTDQVFFVLDSSLLKAGGTQICVDLTVGNLYYTLGFPSTTTWVADGTYTSTNVVRMDAQGTSVDVVCSLTPSRSVNGTIKKILFSVPMVSMTGYTEFVYPQMGEQVPLIQYSGPTSITNYDIQFKTEDNNTMVFMSGSRAKIIFELQEEL